MLIASRFKSVGWVATCALAALGCYLVSLKVAAKRGELGGIEQNIISARQDISRLQTELGTRSRLVQLERWNADVLSLSAPKVQQYVTSPIQLASFAAPPQPALPPVLAPAEVQQASAQPQVVATPAPQMMTASYTLPAAQASAAAAAPSHSVKATVSVAKKPAKASTTVMLAAIVEKKAKPTEHPADHKTKSSSAVASASPVKKSKPAGAAKSTALASADKKAKSKPAAKKTDRTELASAATKKKTAGKTTGTTKLASTSTMKATATKLASASPKKKSDTTKLASAKDKKKADTTKLASVSAKKKADATKLASAADRKTAKSASSKHGSPVKLASAMVAKKKSVASSSSEPRATLRNTTYVKIGRDRPAMQRIALLDDHTMGVINRAARSETQGKKNRQ